jgi:hypothetical protein
MQLDKDNVSGAQKISRIPNGFSGTLTRPENRNCSLVRVRRYPNDADNIAVTADHSDPSVQRY